MLDRLIETIIGLYVALVFVSATISVVNGTEQIMMLFGYAILVVAVLYATHRACNWFFDRWDKWRTKVNRYFKVCINSDTAGTIYVGMKDRNEILQSVCHLDDKEAMSIASQIIWHSGEAMKRKRNDVDK